MGVHLGQPWGQKAAAWRAIGFEGIFTPLITKDLPCPGVRGQRKTALLFQELLISLLLTLAGVVLHTIRRRKLRRHLGGLCPHLVLSSPCAEQPSGGHCLSGQLQGVVGALGDALLVSHSSPLQINF